jgi:hypothetical protein
LLCFVCCRLYSNRSSSSLVDDTHLSVLVNKKDVSLHDLEANTQADDGARKRGGFVHVVQAGMKLVGSFFSPFFFLRVAFSTKLVIFNVCLR